MIPFQQQPQQGKTGGPGHFGAARLHLWAASPPSYLSAPPAHPVELRARRGRCRLALPWNLRGLVVQSSATSPRAGCPRSCPSTGEPPMNTESVRYVGLDVHKRVVEACIVEQRGKVVNRERFALNRSTLALFATKVLRPSDHVALEATTNCWAVADALRPHVARVLVSNPMATKAIAQAKVKTDKVDAHVLAQLLRCAFLPEVWRPTRHTQAPRAH